MSKSIVVRPEPLPDSNESIVLRRMPSLNERVKYLLMNGAYAVIKPYIEAVDNHGAVQGSVRMDKAAAAEALQKYAGAQGEDFVARQNWTSLDHAIGACLRSMTVNGQPIDRNSRRRVALAKLQPSSEPAPTPEA